MDDVLEIKLITMLKNSQATQEEIAVELGVSIASAQRIMKKLSDEKVAVAD